MYSAITFARAIPGGTDPAPHNELALSTEGQSTLSVGHAPTLSQFTLPVGNTPTLSAPRNPTALADEGPEAPAAVAAVREPAVPLVAATVPAPALARALESGKRALLGALEA